MTLFWLIAAAMMLIALGAIAIPFLLKTKSERIDRDQQNLLIARERLDAIEVEFNEGRLSEGEYQQSRSEVEMTLAEELESVKDQAVLSSSKAGVSGLLVSVLLLPLFAFAFYNQYGSPAFVQQTESVSGQEIAAVPSDEQNTSLEGLIDNLAEKLEEEPDNPEGWFLLGKSYMSIARYKEAVAAYEQVMQLIPEKSAGIYLALANAVAMQNGGVISGRPEELVKDALELDSQSAVGLWMAGMAAEEGGRLDEALAYWKRAEPLLAGQPTNQQELRGMMRRVAEQLGSIITFEDSAIQAPSPANSADVINSPGPALQQPSGIKVSVAIDPDLMSSVDPSSTIFVFAKAVSGPPMPLAVVRMQVKDLPAEIMLDDTMAMMPQMKISLFDQVSVSAKISASGVATPQADDINSEAVTVATIDSPSIDLLIR